MSPMTHEELVQRLKESNRTVVARETGLPYRYLRRLVEKTKPIKNPGSRQVDILRSYFLSQDFKQ